MGVFAGCSQYLFFHSLHLMRNVALVKLLNKQRACGYLMFAFTMPHVSMLQMSGLCVGMKLRLMLIEHLPLLLCTDACER